MAGQVTQFETRSVGSDLDLVRASKNGDVAAFEQLVKRHDRKLLRIAQGVTRNTEDSQDVVQEALLKTFQHLGEFREDSKFSTWLTRITINESLIKLRKQRLRREVSLDDDSQTEGDTCPFEAPDLAPNPEQRYQASELGSFLTEALDELRLSLRAVFVLRDIQGLSIDQTAALLNLSDIAVKSRLRRARLQLRERLHKYFSKQTRSSRADASACKLLTKAVPRSHNLRSSITTGSKKNYSNQSHGEVPNTCLRSSTRI
jgi:RNA polymerase sigma-70 factor (ECF subfamily)